MLENCMNPHLYHLNTIHIYAIIQYCYAGVAQPLERVLAKDEVQG